MLRIGRNCRTGVLARRKYCDDRNISLEIKALSPFLRYNKGSRPNGRVFTARFFWAIVFRVDEISVALQQIVEQTVSGLGYDLVEVDRSAGGLLRITIDLPWVAPVAGAAAVEQFINVEDCEKVNRQLQFALEVDGVEYRRLEISSPGIDRPLRHANDFERFVGHTVDLTLKAPMGSSAAGQVHANRKKFRGVLEKLVDANGLVAWQIVWSDAPVAKPGQRVSKKREAPPLQALGFALDELREARLAPIVNFRGRGGPADSELGAHGL